MKLFDVYSLLDMEPVKAEGAYLWDKNGVEYLDFYGGHAVISIGHSHPHYVGRITEQLSNIGFYSNAVINSSWWSSQNTHSIKFIVLFERDW